MPITRARREADAALMIPAPRAAADSATDAAPPAGRVVDSVVDQPVWQPSAEPSFLRRHGQAILAAATGVLLVAIVVAVWAAERADRAAAVPPVPAASPSLGVVPGTAAGPAAADVQFVGILDRLGVPYPDTATATRTGRDVCAHLGRGSRPAAEGTAIAASGAVTPEQASEIVGAAAVAYCPSYRAAVGLPS